MVANRDSLFLVKAQTQRSRRILVNIIPPRRPGKRWPRSPSPSGIIRIIVITAGIIAAGIIAAAGVIGLATL